MKTRKIEQEVVLDPGQFMGMVKNELTIPMAMEELLEVFKVLFPYISTVRYDEETDTFCYSIYSNEIVSWEEEVDNMPYMEVLSKFHQLLLSKRILNLPENDPFSELPTIEEYVRQILRRNEI